MKNRKNMNKNKQSHKNTPKSRPAAKSAKANRGKSGQQRPDRSRSDKRSDQRSDKPRSAISRSNKAQIDLFGIHAVAEAWINPKRHIQNLYITGKALEEFEGPLSTAKELGLKRPEPQIIEKGMLDNATPPGSVHQGIGLICQALESTSIQDFIAEAEVRAENGERSVLVMLDQVTDPHNVGAILRSACVFGSAGIIMQSKHAPALKGVLAKTACGGVEHVPVAYETNLTRALETLQQAGYFTVGLDERGNQPLSELKSYQKLVLVMGAEGPGLRRLVKEQCDALTSLPTTGPISSLNVSNAAAVALFAAVQQ